MTTRTSFRTCGLCEATCGLRLTTEADVVLSVQGDEDDVFSSGYICPKAGALGQLHADPDRLHEPHRRDRASGAWTGTTWDHALGEIGTRLRSTIHSHGPDSVAVYMGNGLTHGATGALYAPALLRALGSRRIFSSSTLDVMPRWLASGLLYGTSTSVPVPDVDRCHTLVVIGANPLVSNGSVWTAPNLGNRLRALKRRGGALVVVDPARTRTARLADEHISIRPGTDVLLLLSIAHVLFALDLVDTGHVPIRAGDLERLRQLLQPFTPSAVAPATGVEVETIQGLAQRIAAAPSAAVYGRLGIHATRWGTLAAWATDVVTVLTGNLDRVGGMMFPKPAHSRPSPSRPRRFRTGRYRSRVSGYPEVNGELPAVALREEIEDDGPDRIRALIVLGANPVLTVPNGRGLRRALSRLDLMVSVDMYANETTALGDYVLPVPSSLERSTYEWVFYGLAIRNVANWSAPTFVPTGPSEADVLARLTLEIEGRDSTDPWLLHDEMVRAAVERSGFSYSDVSEHLWDGDAEDRLLDVALRAGPYGDRFGARPEGLTLETLAAHPHGIDLGPLTSGLDQLLCTESGAVDLIPDLIAGEIERARELLDTPDRPTLVLIGRRDVRSMNSWLHNVPSLSGDRAAIRISPADARRVGVSSGDEVSVRSAFGRVTTVVDVAVEVPLGVASLPGGWGHAPPGQLHHANEHGGVSANELISDCVVDPLSGTAALHGTAIEVHATSHGHREPSLS